MENPIEVILIGAGSRGRNVYGRYIYSHPETFRLVAVADPNPTRRTLVADQHHIPQTRQFTSWEALLAQPQLAQAAIVATQDQYHTEPTLAALQAGYDVLLEKPMAHRQDECIALVKASEEQNRLLQICHVLRYTPIMQKVKQILSAGILGEVVTVAHRENVSFWHMAHSYVRGNWRNSQEASPMILAKCSHDFDLLYWLLERKCIRLSSVGSLQHFRPEQAPEGAPVRCTDGCPVADSCPFEATNIYLRLQPFIAELKLASQPTYRFLGKIASSTVGRTAMNLVTNTIPPLHQFRHYHIWPRSIVSDEPGEPAVLDALKTGPYGRCVYHCDNDVVDHQVVMMELEGGISATLTMHGHSHQEGRTTRIDGTRATLFARMNLFDSEISVHHNRTRRVERYHIPHPFGFGHGGGDAGLMEAFADALTQGQQQPLTNAQASLESHLLAFAAEQARITGEVIDMESYRSQAWQSVVPKQSTTAYNEEHSVHSASAGV